MNNKFRMSLKTHWRYPLILVCFLVMNVFTVFGQNIMVKGTVTEDGTNEPVPGVNIIVEGTSNGVITDLDGKYQIEVASDAQLLFSFIGFADKKVSVNGQTAINVKLESEYTSLDEVVAVGYGTAKKKDLTGAVASVSGEVLTQIPVSSPAEAMAGRMAGVQITTSDGSPDSEVIVRIRGGGSITQDNSPLYIVDGFPVSSISDISSSDIEAIDVLKDASSTAIYGSQGANGVVIITTKSAKGGKTTVTYNGYIQSKKLANELDVLDPYEFAMTNYEYAALKGDNDIESFEKKYGVYDDLDLYKYQKGKNWQDDMFGASVLSQQHNLSITGGTEKTKFSLSNSYVYNGGLIPSNKYKRYNLNFKLNHELADNLKLNFTARISDNEINGSGTAGDSYKVRTSRAVTRAPIQGLEEFVQIDPGTLSEDDYKDWVENNMTLAEQAEQYWRRRYKRKYYFGGSLDWKIIKNLSYKVEGGYEYGFEEDQKYWGVYTSNASFVGGNPLTRWIKKNSNKLRVAQTLNYNITVNSVHKISAMIGQEIVNKKYDNTEMYRTNFSPDATPEKIFATQGNALEGSDVAIDSYYSPDDNLASFFGRVGYNFKGRYLFQATVREDGSSKFAKANHWGFFPSASVGWRINEEPFMDFASNVLSNLKLRLSYGEAGNNRIDNVLYKLQYKTSSTTDKTYGINDASSSYYKTSKTQLPNPDLKWETMITRNVGLDFGLFNERLSGTLEGYWNSSKDLLIERDIVAPGYKTTIENIGETSNRGIEFALNAAIIQKSDFTLSANFNIGFNRTKVDYIAEGIEMQAYASNWASTDNKGYYDYQVRLGESLGLIYGWETEGYYTTDDFESYDETSDKYILKDDVSTSGLYGGVIGIRPGTIKLKDQQQKGEEGYGVVDENDRKIIGNATPDFTGGFGLNGTFKGFDASVLFSFVYGNDIYNANKIATTQPYRTNDANLLSIMSGDNRYSYLNRSTGELVTSLEELRAMNEGDNAKEYWSPFSFGKAVVLPHSWAVEDGSFLRLQNVSLGYTLPKKITQKANIQKFRLYCTASNLWVLTNYSGYDPEVSSKVRSSSTSGLTPGVDYSSYPKSVSWTFGVNVTF